MSGESIRREEKDALEGASFKCLMLEMLTDSVSDSRE